VKALFVAVVLLALTGCVSVAKVETGEHTVGDRMAVTLMGAWNHVNAPNLGPAQVWTMEGLPADQLLLFSGLKDGEAVHATAVAERGKKNFVFRSKMQPDEIANLFEGAFSRDGSSFKLVKLEPAAFGGGKGVRFEYSMVRKVDNVQLSGLGYAGVSRGELFAIIYMAPRLAFFDRHVASVDQIARSARVKP